MGIARLFGGYFILNYFDDALLVSVDDVVEVFWFFLQFVVEVERGFRGDSSAEVAHGPRGGVEVHLAPVDDYLETTNIRVADSFFIDVEGGLSRAIGDVRG